MDGIIKNPETEEKSKQEKEDSKISRRGFLIGSAAAIGGAALVGNYKDASACPIHAYTKTPEGAVLYDPEKCFGCRYCMIACPFYVPAYDYESALEPKIVKCVMCHDRIKTGGIPACADACPVGAITFGKRSELINVARKKIMDNPDRYINHIYGEQEAGGTSWLYISGVPFEHYGFPTNLPKKPLIEETKGFLGAVPVVFTVWPALFGMAYAALRHREDMEKQKHGKEEEKK